MDPLSALSVAAAVVQFVDYSSRMVSKSREIYKSADGALAENIDLEVASKCLQRLTEPLRGSQIVDALGEVCKACSEVSNELVDRLDTLKVPDGHAHKRWKSVRQALKITWSKEKIQEIKARLDDLRKELDTHVLIGLRSRISIIQVQQDSRFNVLDATTRRIITAMVEGQHLIKVLDEKIQALNLSHSEEHAKTREILVDQERQRRDFHIQQSLLKSLWFETIDVRHETIAETHENTFKWIFRDPDTEGKSWSNFSEWLGTGNGIYWIHGKPGSGKSTLIKFIVDHAQTREHLRRWAGNATIETPTFFFWKNGTLEQRSHIGLLRSLLYEVLEKHPSPIPDVFPEDWERSCRLASSGNSVTFNVWTLVRLKKAFQQLISQASDNLRFCFFIDGLDEYDGDYEDMSIYISKLGNSPFVKLCISSRPWPIFKETFEGCPQLRLQDLTYGDITRYIGDKFNGHVRVQSLRETEPGRTSLLIKKLAWKAEGVFLWVTLVVKSLLKGLGDRNSIETLEKRVDALPPNLEHVYDHMLSLIDPFNLEEGSKIFQLHRVEDDLEIIYYALKADMRSISEILNCSDIFNKSMISQSERFEEIAKEMEDMLQSRCGGLLEVVRYDMNLRRGEVSYIHRTLSDYLETSVLNDIIKHTKHTLPDKDVWNPHLAVLKSSILCLRGMQYVQLPSIAAVINHVDDLWYLMGQYSRKLTKSLYCDVEIMIPLLEAFDAAATTLFGQFVESKGSQDDTTRRHWFNYGGLPLWRDNFMSAAVYCNHWFYIKRRLTEDPLLIQNASGAPLLLGALLRSYGRPFSARERTIGTLLDFGANPNECFEGYTLVQYWVHILHVCIESSRLNTVSRKYIKTISRGLLQAGADFNASCIPNSGIWDGLFKKKGTPSRSHSISPFIYPFIYIDYKELAHHSMVCKDTDDSESAQYRTPDEQRKRFETEHCFSAVIRDLFTTEEEPNEADELLELIERLKAKKETKEAAPGSATQKRKKRRRKGKNRT